MSPNFVSQSTVWALPLARLPLDLAGRTYGRGASGAPRSRLEGVESRECADSLKKNAVESMSQKRPRPPCPLSETPDASKSAFGRFRGSKRTLVAREKTSKQGKRRERTRRPNLTENPNKLYTFRGFRKRATNPRRWTVNLLAYAFQGSNPCPTTTSRIAEA